MRWKRSRGGGGLMEDRRGRGGFGGGGGMPMRMGAGLGLPGILIVLALLFFGGGLGGGGGGGFGVDDPFDTFQPAAQDGGPAVGEDAALFEFVRFVFADANGMWA